MPEVRYFFSYHEFNGLPWPMVWRTENGVTIGGHPTEYLGKPLEITAEEANLPLVELTRKYPRKEVAAATTETEE
jgi:hypothetical protein